MKAEIPSDFNPSICLSRKVRLLNRVIANVFRRYLSPFNLTDSQLTILFVLSKKGLMTQKEIATILRLEKSSLHRNLKRLFDRQIISKDHFPRIELTASGTAFLIEVIPEWEKAMKEVKKVLNEDGVLAIELLTSKI